jgi:hypothetical protein
VKLKKLIREFAEREPLEENERATDIAGYSCVYCYGSSKGPIDDVRHKPDCVWVLVRQKLGLPVVVDNSARSGDDKRDDRDENA